MRLGIPRLHEKMMEVSMSVLDGMIAEDTSCDRGPLLFGGTEVPHGPAMLDSCIQDSQDEQ